MEDNIFLQNQKKLTLKEYMGFDGGARGNLGDRVSVEAYRLMEYSIKEQLVEQFGKEVQIGIFQKAGFRAGVYFTETFLDTSLDLNQFIASLQMRMEELKIGVLRIEKFDESTGRVTLTVAEDADCSGLPLLGETVCNYDEGFIAGILSTYLKVPYTALEVDCWATGDRVCRFCAEPKA